MIEYPANSIGYQKEAFNSFSAEFLIEEKCNSWFVSLTHPSVPGCPSCKTKITDSTTLKNFAVLKRCQCKSCNHWFTAKTGTILQDSKISVTEFYLLCLLLEWKIPTAEIAHIIKTSQSTVNLWQKKMIYFRKQNKKGENNDDSN